MGGRDVISSAISKIHVVIAQAMASIDALGTETAICGNKELRRPGRYFVGGGAKFELPLLSANALYANALALDRW